MMDKYLVRFNLYKIWVPEGFKRKRSQYMEFLRLERESKYPNQRTSMTFDLDGSPNVFLRCVRKALVDDGFGVEEEESFQGHIVFRNGIVQPVVDWGAPQEVRESVLSELDSLLSPFRRSMFLVNMEGDFTGHEMFVWESDFEKLLPSQRLRS